MRIGIYIDVAMEKEPRGIGFHIINLVRALSRVDRDNEYLLYHRRDIFRNSGSPFHGPGTANFRMRPVRAPQRLSGNHPKLWWNHYLPFVIAQDRIDVFHGPNFFLPLLSRGNTAVTIHDLAFLKMDLYSPGVSAAMRHWTSQSTQRAGRVIALSKSTQHDLEEQGVDRGRIHVIYGGGNITPESAIRFDRSEELRRQLNLPEKYILFVGTIHPRKNVPFLLRSFARLKREHNLPHKLVLAGRLDAAASDVERLIAELGIAADTRITGYVEDWQIPLLYKMADAFVLPSHYEGFGMCVVEAMAYGVPVIASDTSSLREVVGDAGLLVTINDDTALSNALHRCLTDLALHSELRERGKRQSAQFSWDRNAERTLALYQDIHAEQATRRRRHDCARTV